jgi:hypothetical protein
VFLLVRKHKQTDEAARNSVHTTGMQQLLRQEKVIEVLAGAASVAEAA